MPHDTPLASGHAPGKMILFGEHAVVYGRPAIAAPVAQVQAHATVFPADRCEVIAPDIGRRVFVDDAADADPFAQIVRLVCAALGEPLPRWRVVITSEIPIASGLGSGAAIATATARALLTAFGAALPPERLSALVYEVEKLHHGTPSGIDNTVIVYEQPVWFVRGQPPEPFHVGAALHFLVADTGVASPTRIAVGDVRASWQAEPARFEALYDGVGALVHRARSLLEAGDVADLGPLLDENHALLVEMGVSSPELDRLCTAARAAGALGAKLSGGGRGGNMIALVEPARRADVERALLEARATRVFSTDIMPTHSGALP